MGLLEGGAFDPETLALMNAALDDAWASLSQEQRACRTPAELARRIVALARRGERDPRRLRSIALINVVGPKQVDR